MSGFSHWAMMGGYAAFVWPAYGVAAAVLGGITVQSWRRYRASARDLERLERPRRAGKRDAR
jgi:heme exporter protein CcmD